MPNIQLQDTVTVSKDAVWCDLEGEVAVLQISSGVYFGLEGPGCEMWDFIQQPKTVTQIVDHLMTSYEVTREICERQTLAFLEEMATRGLVSVHTHAVVT
jgi:Coenzyme PQQ synthesis protein D (PqqD)